MTAEATLTVEALLHDVERVLRRILRPREAVHQGVTGVEAGEEVEVHHPGVAVLLVHLRVNADLGARLHPAPLEVSVVRGVHRQVAAPSHETAIQDNHGATLVPQGHSRFETSAVIKIVITLRAQGRKKKLRQEWMSMSRSLMI